MWVANGGWGLLSLIILGQLPGAFSQRYLQKIDWVLLQHLISTTQERASEALLTAHFGGMRAG